LGNDSGKSSAAAAEQAETSERSEDGGRGFRDKLGADLASRICSGVNIHIKQAGSEVVVIARTQRSIARKGAGEWMWAAVVVPIKPEKVPVRVQFKVVSSMESETFPIPGLTVGGFS
jgi:hypothetical protein